MSKNSTLINLLPVYIYKIGIILYSSALCYFYLVLHIGCNMVQGNSDPAGVHIKDYEQILRKTTN